MSDNKQKGQKGEDIACEYLINAGYEIKKRNFHFGREGEIDIIAEKDNYLVFVEVKFRTNNSYGDPLESITPKKAKTLQRAAEGYMYVNKFYDKPCRIDVVIVDFRGSEPAINHIENAVY